MRRTGGRHTVQHDGKAASGPPAVSVLGGQTGPDIGVAVPCRAW